MDVNFVRYTFGFYAATVFIISIFLHEIEEYVPLSIRRSFRYGKHAEHKDHALVKHLELPKRWFKHFYIFAAPLTAVSLVLTVNIYFFGGKVPDAVCCILDTLLGSSRNALVETEQTFLAMLLFTFHSWKRLYETTCVSVFSDAKINISHYIIGFVHYLGSVCCIIGESHGFFKSSKVDFHWEHLRTIDYIAACIFLCTTLLQLHSNFILAGLRKDKKDGVVTQVYKIPHGGLFNYVTGVLQLCEITLYLTLSTILWKASTLHFVTLWVLANQTETAIDSHLWYKKTFKAYPKNRKIIVPFLI